MSNKDKAKFTWQDFKHVPRWTWLFLVACIILPITTIGGAIPSVLAMLGIILCAKVSLSTRISTAIKLMLCFGISTAVWGLGYISLWVVSVYL